MGVGLGRERDGSLFRFVCLRGEGRGYLGGGSFSKGMSVWVG